MVPKSKLEHFVQHILPNGFSGDELTPDRCFFAFYLAIRALAEQLCGQLETAEKTARMAELEIAKLSVDFSSDYYHSSACLFISHFHFAMGDNTKSDYYQYIHSYYWTLGKKPTDMFEAQLKNLGVFWKGHFGDTVINFKSLLGTLPFIYQGSSAKLLEHDLPEGVWDYVKNSQITMHNYKIYLDILDMVHDTLVEYRKQLVRTMVDCHTDTFFAYAKIIDSIVLEGVKCKFLCQLSPVFIPSLEELAHEVSIMTEHPLFPYSVPGTFISILCISKHHLSCCEMVESGSRSRVFTITSSKTQQLLTIDYFEELKRDYRALQSLSKKYPFITKQHGATLQSIQHMLDRIQQHNTTKDTTFQNQLVSNQQNNTQEKEVMQNDEILMALLKYVQAVSQNVTLN